MKRTRRFDGMKLGLLRDAKWFVMVALLVFLLFQLVIGVSQVKGNSMLPTLSQGNIVIYSRISKEYAPGEILSIRFPSGQYFVKRVIAVPGDTVAFQDGKVFVNGKALTEPYIQGESFPEAGILSYPYIVPKGHYFVLGDNREVSEDSRNFGAVATSQIRGKIMMVLP